MGSAKIKFQFLATDPKHKHTGLPNTKIKRKLSKFHFFLAIKHYFFSSHFTTKPLFRRHHHASCIHSSLLQLVGWLLVLLLLRLPWSKPKPTTTMHAYTHTTSAQDSLHWASVVHQGSNPALLEPPYFLPVYENNSDANSDEPSEPSTLQHRQHPQRFQREM